jgi:hypothetical protein
VSGQRGGDNQADGGGGPENMVVGSEEERGDEAADHDGSDDRGWGQAKDQGKADGLRDRNEGEGGAGNQIGVELAPGVMAQLMQKREAHARDRQGQRLSLSGLVVSWTHLDLPCCGEREEAVEV